MIDTLVIFGATGDLAGRLLLPAVAALRANGRLGAQFRLIGAAPQERMPAALAHLLYYQQADVTNPADVAAVLDVATQRAPGPVAVYLALPTQLMSDAVRALPPLPAGSRIAVEKPFGHDAGSAVELNTALAALSSGDIDAVYRVDHALAMTGVQHLRAARYPMTGEPIEWSNQRIAQADLLWEETLALEGRASFYDRAGALRDVMQNHLVQVLCTVAAPPGTAADRSVRHADVLRAVRPMTPADVRRRTRRARYTAGRSAQGSGRDVPDYVAEDGVTRPATPRRSPRSSSNSTPRTGSAPGSSCAQARPWPLGAAGWPSTSGRPGTVRCGWTSTGRMTAMVPLNQRPISASWPMCSVAGVRTRSVRTRPSWRGRCSRRCCRSGPTTPWRCRATRPGRPDRADANRPAQHALGRVARQVVKHFRQGRQQRQRLDDLPGWRRAEADQEDDKVTVDVGRPPTLLDPRHAGPP